jgi:hypothetical protein
VWNLARFWMNEDLPREEARALAIMGAKNEQREADAKIAEMNGSPEIAAAIRGDRDKSQLPAEIRTGDDEA